MIIHLKSTPTQWFWLIWNIWYNKKSLFQLVVYKIYATIKTVYCFNWLPWTFTGSSRWEVFLEINLNQKTLKFYTFWVHWKNQCWSTVRKHALLCNKHEYQRQCRSTVRKHALLCNKHEYQHSTDIFIKNIFNPFPGTGLFLYFLKYIRKSEVSWYFRGALKESSAIKWVKSHFIFRYLFCYLFK